MAVHVKIECDNPDCNSEYSTNSASVYDIVCQAGNPYKSYDWQEYDGKTFCAVDCLARFLSKQAIDNLVVKIKGQKDLSPKIKQTLSDIMEESNE